MQFRHVSKEKNVIIIFLLFLLLLFFILLLYAIFCFPFIKCLEAYILNFEYIMNNKY